MKLQRFSLPDITYSICYGMWQKYNVYWISVHCIWFY